MDDLFQEKPQARDLKAPDVKESVAVLVPYPVDKAYDYAVPEGMAMPAHGAYVCVPLGGRNVIGVVWGTAEGGGKRKLKEIVSLYDMPSMPQDHRGFIDWVARYTMNAKGAVLKMALSSPKALEPESGAVHYRIALSPVGRGLGEGHKDSNLFTGRATPHQTTQKARDLRRDQTEAEKKLWFNLNNRQLEGFKFRRQYPVHPYITDFCCLEHKLIIELDGGQHAEQAEYDAARTAFLGLEGFKVLRFWNNEITENLDGVLGQIRQALICPSPNPLPTGERALTSKQKAVLGILSDNIPRRLGDLAKAAGCGTGVVKTMASKGLLETIEIPKQPPCVNPRNIAHATLSEDQRAAADHMCACVKDDAYHGILLDGVTGAGKTETYFEAVAEALDAGKQILILLPEIALSNAFLERFKQRFGCAPALWHSQLTPAQRRTTWRGVATGQSRVVVGARSALFLPYADLGLIIVDEEHDPAYKQEEGIIYHARDMAVVRASLSKIPVVLVSATPALETIHNAWGGRYDHLHLPDRFGGARLPDVHLIDMREDKPERQHFIAPSLKNAMIETLQSGEQVLLFLNRRGYAPLTLCRSCGHRLSCPCCTAWLVEHKQSGRLHCHHCGYHAPLPEECPECGEKDSFAACGPGVERIEEEVRQYFPDARTLLLASDTAESQEQLREMLSDIRDHKVDIIIGTQIIAKGHHFPNLTCVGVIDADLGLQGGELRAAERVYQLLHQVAGRAGREEKKGHVYIQSFMPDHPIMYALARGTRDQFLEAESMARESAHMPPYSRLAGVIVSGRDEGEVKFTAEALGCCAPQGEKIQSFGPAPAPFARLRGKFRYRLLIRADKNVDLQKTLRAWVQQIKTPSKVRVQIDIDPQSFF